jgi:hypothetical protein
VNVFLPDNKGGWVNFEDTTGQLTILGKRTIAVKNQLDISLGFMKIILSNLLGLGVVLLLHFYSIS